MAGPADRGLDRGLTSRGATPSARARRRLALALLVVGCQGSPQAQPAPVTSTTPASSIAPGVDAKPVDARPVDAKPALHGCAAIETGPDSTRCLLSKPRPLTLWFAGDSHPRAVEVRLDDAPIHAAITAEADGLLLRLEPGVIRGQLSLQAGAQRWIIELAPLSSTYQEARKQAIAQARAGESEQAQATLTAAAAELRDPREAPLLRCVAAQIAYSSDDLEAVIAAPAAIAAGLDPGSPRPVSCLAEAHMQAAFVRLDQLPDFAAAEAHIAAAEAEQAEDLQAQIGTRYLRGVLEHRLGRVDESLRAFEASATLADRAGAQQRFAAARVMQAVALARLGRFAEAEALAAEVEDRLATLAGAEQLVLEIRSNLAWIAVLRGEDGDGHGHDDPILVPRIEALIADFERLEDRPGAARARLNLAYAQLQAGAFTQARATLAAIDRGQLDPHYLVWVELLAAQVEIGRRRFAEAEARLLRAERYTDLTRDREHVWRVALARAELERARGRPQQAIAAHQRAAELADALALAVPGIAGRSDFVTTHARSDADHVALLLEQGQDRAGFCVAAASRARHMRSLWSRLRPELPPAEHDRYRRLLAEHQAHRETVNERLRDAWSLSDAELGELQAQLRAEAERDEARIAEATALLEAQAPRWRCEGVLPDPKHDARDGVLTMVRGGDQVWFLLAIAGRDDVVVEHRRIGELTPDQLATQMIAAMAPALSELETLQVIPAGAFMTVEFHRLIATALDGGGPVLRYSLGLGRVDDDDREPEQAPLRAAVIAGADDLAAVAEEARSSGASLRAKGWSVVAAWSPADEPQPTLLHYSGHGHRAGVGGWQSDLELPDYGRLSATQIVASQRAPRWVVLAACSAAAPDPRAVDGGMNLAAAFLLAGAELVIAPTRTVEDQTALASSRALYRSTTIDADALVRELAALQRDQLEAGEPEDPAKRTSSWRAWVP